MGLESNGTVFMLIGYARVSSTSQDLSIQVAALKEAGCERIFSEKRSGREAETRSALRDAIAFARSGDSILVTRLDRWARSVRDLHNLLAELTVKCVGFRCIEQASVDTTTPTGKLTLAILAGVAEFETDLRAERQREGIEKAKAEGRYRGRSASVDYEQVRKLRSQGINPTQIAGLLGIGRTTVYRALSA
jgi:DNA invertase Pin-like site-specific DNA recombinase